MMIEDLQELLGSVLLPLGCQTEPGDEVREPPLDVLMYYTRPLKLSPIPLIGRGLSVVAVIRQPIDIGISEYGALVARLARVLNTRFPPIKGGVGLTLGFTAVVTTPEPIMPEDDPRLDQALASPGNRHRAVPLGVFRVNLGQEAVAFSLRRGPENLFPEPEAIADALSLRLRRFARLSE